MSYGNSSFTKTQDSNAGRPDKANDQGGPATVDAAEWAKNPTSVSGLQPPHASTNTTRGDVIIIYGERAVATDIANSDGVRPIVPEIGADGNVRIQIPAPSSTTVPKVPAETIRQQEPMNPPSVKTSTVPASVPAQPKAVKSEKTAPKAVIATIAVKPAIPVDEYWVQTGAFSTKARADGAKEILKAKGIASLVETKDVNGKNYFRVRVGPYSSKKEAEYWLSLVMTVDGFNESYVSMIKAKR
jgi:DedD protein